MSFVKSNIQLQNVLPALSSKRHSFFQDEKEQILSAFINTPHFQSFRMDEPLKKALEQCYQQINYFLFGAKKILHQYGKNSENQFFIVKGEANVYEYKLDSELEIECYYTATRSKLKEEIESKQNQLKNITQTIANSTSENKLLQSISTSNNSKGNQNLNQQIYQELSTKLQKEISILDNELQAIENILDKRFAFFDAELDIIRDYDQFFIDEVCLVKFVKKLKENDSFGIVDNNRDQIIFSSTEIHLTNISTEVYQIYLIPLKAINEFFAFYLKECKLDTFIQFRNITENYFNKSEVVYDAVYSNPKKEQKKNMDHEDNSGDSDNDDDNQKQPQIALNGPVNTIYLVRSGVFQISKFKEKRFLPIRTLRPGDFFGIEDLFLDSHQFRVICLSEKGCVYAYNLPPTKEGLNQNLYQQGEFMNLKQKEKIYNVQQKFLQYYAKIYLDVIEQSVENNKTFSEIFAPMMNKLIKLEKDSNLRKEEEAKEKKYIKLDGIIIEMPVEEDIPKARFDLKLQPFVINTQKQSFQQNIQQQLSNNPNNNPNLNELVNKLQIKINSRKQSQEKLVLKKKGSQSELIQLLNGNEIDSNTNSNNISQNMIYRSSDLVQQPTTQIIQDNQQDLSQNQSINITLSKQSSQTNYQFQPYAAKPNSRDISPQSNQVRKLKKNFTIAPIQQSTDLLTKSKQKTLSQTNLEEIKDISKNINNEEKKTPLKIVLNKDNVYQLNSNHNKAIPKTYFMDTNSPAKQQLNKAQIFKKQHTLKGTKDLGASPKIHNVQRQIHPTDSNIVGGKNQQSPLSEKKQISETIGQKANVLKMKKNLIEGQRHSIDVQNINQSSCDSLPYIQQNLSSSQLLNSNTHSANITNGFSQILQMTNSQKSKSYNNLSFKNQTEGNEQSSTRMINNTYNQIEKTPINFYQQNTPSLTNIENLNKQNKPINQIYYETTTKSQQQSEQKPINAIQSFSQLQDNSMFHNSNKLHSSIILGYSSPQQDRQSSGIKLKSDRFSDITQKKLTSNKKLIQLQQQQPLNNVQTNNEFSQPNSLINSTNFNKLISSNTAQKIDSSSTIPTINNSKQGSQSKIKGLLESKQEMRNLSNSNSSQKLFSGELSPNVIIKNQMAQQNYYQKIDSPQTKETNFTQQLQQQQQ